MKNFLNTISKLPEKLTISSEKIKSLISKTAKSAMMALGISTAAHALPVDNSLHMKGNAHVENIQKSSVSVHRDWIKNNKQNHEVTHGIRLDSHGEINLHSFEGKRIEYDGEIFVIKLDRLSVRNHKQFREVIYTFPHGNQLILATTPELKKSSSNGVSDESFLVNQIIQKVHTTLNIDRNVPHEPKSPFPDNAYSIAFRPERFSVVGDDESDENEKEPNDLKKNPGNIIDESFVPKTENAEQIQVKNDEFSVRKFPSPAEIFAKRRASSPKEKTTFSIPKITVSTILKDFQKDFGKSWAMLQYIQTIHKDIQHIDFLDTPLKQKFALLFSFWQTTFLDLAQGNISNFTDIEKVRAHKKLLTEFATEISMIKLKINTHYYPQNKKLMGELNQISSVIEKITQFLIRSELALFSTKDSK